mgnify:CR=1 FL=1|tara:strand:- start:4500 stop:4673 length:174 start_codon:yes stop_codon:yes gene_type:complete
MKITITAKRIGCMSAGELDIYYKLNPDKRLKIKHKKGVINKIDFTKLEEIMKEREQE